MSNSAPRRLVARFESPCAGRRLVVDLCGPEEAGLSREERLVMRLLWDADGLPERCIAEQLCLSSAGLDDTLGALQRKGLVERDEGGGTADVWLTAEGRRARDLVSDRVFRPAEEVLEPAAFVARA